VTFSMNGSRIISGASDNTLKVWNTHSGRAMYTIKHHTSSIFCVAASPDGTRIASGDTAHRLRVWRVPPFLADEDN